MPDDQPLETIERIRAKVSVHPPALENLPPREQRKPGPLCILRAAIWERDKNPEDFFQAVGILKRRDVRFRLNVIGQSFREDKKSVDWRKIIIPPCRYIYDEGMRKHRSIRLTASACPAPRNGMRDRPSEFTDENHDGLMREVRPQIRSFVMASEAKIGLLLGLVIIFVIAFVLNELPRSGEAADDESSNDLIVEEQAPTADNERDHVERSIPAEPAIKQVENSPTQDNSDQTPAYSSLPASRQIPSEPNEEAPVSQEKSIKKAISEFYYVVSEGDNLADIAKKFYGPIQGNKRANVLRIFLANSKFLTSPHKIRVGQKLVIPRLPSSESGRSSIASVLPGRMFEKVDSIGMRHLSPENAEPKSIREYVVREGDNLWSVAAAQLGDPTRYKEICRLNAGRLKDQDALSVDMRLYLPDK
jgi:nucleoid-associated protein YgaU